MKKTYKVIALGLVAMIMGSAVIGCAVKKSVDELVEADKLWVEELVEVTSQQEEQQAVTIRTVSQFGGTDLATEVYEAKLLGFKDENPKITVEDESATSDEVWKAKVAADFAAGNEPDVIFTSTGEDVRFIIEQGKFVPLEEIRTEFPNYASNISEGVLNSVQEFDGKTYAIPVRGFYQGLFVNKALFESNNLALPTDWEKLEMAVITLRENGIVPAAAALGQLPDYWIDHFILSEGGVDAHKSKDIAAVKGDWVKGLEYFKELYDIGAFPKDTSSISNDSVTEMFIKGEAAMLLDGNWVIDRFVNLDEITVLPFPTVPGGVKDPSDIVSGFGEGWYITRKAWDNPAKRTAVIKFVEKMTTTEVIGDFVATGGAPSADVGKVEGLPSTAIAGFKMQASAKNIDMPINSWLAKPAWEKLLSFIPSIATGEQDISEAVDKVISLSKE